MHKAEKTNQGQVVVVFRGIGSRRFGWERRAVVVGMTMLCSGHRLHSVFTGTMGHGSWYHPCFPGEETEAQRCPITGSGCEVGLQTGAFGPEHTASPLICLKALFPGSVVLPAAWEQIIIVHLSC